ncbi:hypothetical protein [Pseudomonas sp. MWU12-2323]|uniref:hypothetical protein n=1 Tax=Pseudomonas sp. MWU12-2323 TaxID=2651296 RepID=UPI00128BDD35|nr:hypothetical protein [Pseudomonas sp. MWU12-2323]MPQ71534.1 hypothetical protein [Pseudomonas sp. MWU12-2323]
MKSIKAAVLNRVQSVIRVLDSKPQVRLKAFSCGFLSIRTPRFIRRLAAGSELHRFWLRGKMTKCLDVNGRCYAAEGRLLPFQVEFRNFPILIPQEFFLVLSIMFLMFTTVGFVCSLRPLFAS